MTELRQETWILLGPAADIASGEARQFAVGDKRICVVAAHDGALYAVDDLCTHGKAYLSDGYCDLEACVLECPLHGGLFDIRTGKAVGAPAERDLQAYQVKIVDGGIYVQIGRS